MRRLINFSILVIIILTSTFNSSLAQLLWIKDPSNPVLTNGSVGSWDEQGVWAPSVLIHNSTYHMWYSTSDFAGIGHATSTDGINWQRDSQNPVLIEGPANSWEDEDVSAPMVMVVNDTFHLWYSGHDVPQNHLGYRIGHATSVDGSNWVKDTLNPVLDMGNSGSWDDTWVYSGSALFDGSNYHLYYNAWDGEHPDSVRTGHATSPVPNGRNWIKDPANPVLIPTLTWERNRLEGNNVLFDGSMFHTWYTAGDFFSDAQIGYATSPDGSNWTRYTNNPVLSFGQSGQWDDNSVYWPSVFFDGSEYKMWYSGWNGVTEQIGYATSTITSISNSQELISPNKYLLKQNYPNPFNPTTTIEFSIPKSEFVTLKIFNLLGQELEELVSNKLSAGSYTYTWDATDFASGVYYSRIITENGHYQSKKLLLLK